MAVLDASAAVEILLKTPLGLRNTHRVFEFELHAPHFIDLEFAHVMRRLALAGQIASERAELSLELLADMPLIRHPHIPLLRRIWALRISLSAYDAAYVALAESLDTSLLTCDAKLARSHGHHAHIELLS